MKLYKYSLNHISAVATWVIVSTISLFLMWQSPSFSASYLTITILLCCIYIVLWLYIAAPNNQVTLNNRKIASIALFAVIIAIYFQIPLSFVAIYMVIYSPVLLYFMNIKRALLVLPLLSAPLFVVFYFYWQQEYSLISALLFWAFNIFSLVMVNSSIREREARLNAELLASQLQATKSLLNEAVKQSERVRIARNIHDLIGHHLTALAINLQVASRKSEGEVKDSIDQCHQLSKLLLSDVREAVSDIRDKNQLDLEASINAMLENLSNLSLDLDIHNDIEIEDIQVADAIIKTIQETITNTLKHAHGSAVSVKLEYKTNNNEQLKQLQVDIMNKGTMPKSIILGNGLTGIKERLHDLKGNANFKIENGQFHTQLLIPVAQHD